MAVLRGLVLALAAGCAAAGIYPDGHFDVATKLTTGNYKDVIQKAIDDDHAKSILNRFMDDLTRQHTAMHHDEEFQSPVVAQKASFAWEEPEKPTLKDISFR